MELKLTLKAIRANKNMTQAAAAKAIGVGEVTWANYEKGDTYPNVPIIQKIEKAFNVKYADIDFDTQHRHND